MPSDLYKKFFAEEFVLNHLIGTLSVPHVAIIDGITSLVFLFDADCSGRWCWFVCAWYVPCCD